MAYLIVNASPRAKGNSDTLSRLAEQDIRERGAEAQTLALREMELRQCTGCMRCVFHGERCRLDDDIYRILEAVRDCEGLVLVAPTYVTTIPATLKRWPGTALCLVIGRFRRRGRGSFPYPVTRFLQALESQRRRTHAVSLYRALLRMYPTKWLPRMASPSVGM